MEIVSMIIMLVVLVVVKTVKAISGGSQVMSDLNKTLASELKKEMK